MKGEITNNVSSNGKFSNYTKHIVDTLAIRDIDKSFKIYENYFRKNILHLLDNKNARILEIGSGLGHFLFFLQKNNFFDFSGIDLVEENVNFCISKGYKVRKVDMFDYVKTCNEKFDIIVLNNVLEHVKKDKILPFLTELKNILSVKGQIFIIVPNCNNISGVSTFFSDFTHETAFTEKILQQIADQLILRCKTYNLYPYPNYIFIDEIFYIINKIRYSTRFILHLLNGQRPYKVNSKNLLCMLSI